MGETAATGLIGRPAPGRESGTTAGGDGRADAVLDELAALVGALPAPRSLRRLLRIQIDEGRAQLAVNGLPAARLPLLVHSALAGDGESARPLAAACLLVYLGADLLDNVADRELTERWSARSPAEATLAAATTLAALVQIALERLEDAGAPPARSRAVRQAFTRGLLAMAAGQHDDLRLSGAEIVTPEQARVAAERKSGAELRLFAEAAATLAAADPETVGRLGRFGHALGTGGQIASDLADLCTGAGSRDLAEGKRTLPVAYALAGLSGAPHRRLLATLRAAQEDPSARAEAVAAVAAAGGIAGAALVVEVYRWRSLRELREVPGARPEAVRELAALVDDVLPGLSPASAAAAAHAR